MKAWRQVPFIVAQKFYNKEGNGYMVSGGVMVS